jgi:hypothetical protein
MPPSRSYARAIANPKPAPPAIDGPLTAAVKGGQLLKLDHPDGPSPSAEELAMQPKPKIFSRE